MSRVGLVFVLAGCFSKPGPLGGGTGVTARVWSKRDNASQPGQLLAPKMAYDVKRGHVVMYGGDGDSPNSMWELDDAGWTQICDTCTPGDLYNQAFDYDRERGRVVMFGGFDSSVINGKLWEFDTVWLPKIVSPSPPALQLQQMVYDEQAHVSIMFGGATDNPPATWSRMTYLYDGNAWTATASGPEAADDASVAVYDVAHHRTLSADGDDPSTYSDALSMFDGQKWQTVCDPCSGIARADATMVYDRGWGTALWIGGYAATGRLTSVSMLDETDHWLDTNVVLPDREGWGAAYDEGRDRIVLYGGWANPGEPCDDPGACNGGYCGCSETWEGAPVF